MKIETRDVTPEAWTDIERLFGANGACGGCWCMSWRVRKGERWADVKGEEARRRLREGVATGTILGVLAYVDGVPVGWCTYGPRVTFAKLDRAPSFKCEDAEDVVSIPCFYVKAGFREKGVSTALLAHALKVMRRKKVEVVEGYPSKPDAKGRYIPTFAWTGTQSLFAKAGFRIAGNRDGGKQRVRLVLERGNAQKKPKSATRAPRP